MKRNKLDKAKIISDFIFLWYNNPEEKAEIVFDVKHKLTAHGFEKYMQYYFKKFWYKAFLNGDTYEYDGGIDIIWEKNKGDLHIELIAQCKKYSIKDITEEQLRSFIGGVYVQDKNLLDPSHSILYFITTTKFTQKAREYSRKANIHLVDFSKIYEMQSRYDVEEFLEDIRINEVRKEYEKYISKEQQEIFSWVPENIKSSDVVQFLKQIRRDILSSQSENMQLYDIAKNTTLDLLARYRPHNLNALKQVQNKCSKWESEKLAVYGYIFTERLKYIWS